jgi:hypothetical protein
MHDVPPLALQRAVTAERSIVLAVRNGWAKRSMG